MIVTLIIFGVLAVTALFSVGWAVMIYNGLVRMKNNIEKSWSNIDVVLKQRFDELPKLVEVCKGYMVHEAKTLEKVIKARSLLQDAKTQDDEIGAQNAISGALKSLFAVSEKYPELKADASFRQLQARISELEDTIADRREFFNESVNLFNIAIEQFPDVIIARAFNYKARTLWEINSGDRRDVKVSFT